MNHDTERAAFLAAIKHDRYDTLTRLAYADWLEERGEDDEAAEQRRQATPVWQEADRWLHDFAAKCGETAENYGIAYDDWDRLEWRQITYDDLIKAGHDYVREEDFFVQSGSDTARDLMQEGDNYESYWRHWETVTGCTRKAPGRYESRSAPFSCSC